jgi:hypothetical protein
MTTPAITDYESLSQMRGKMSGEEYQRMLAELLSHEEAIIEPSTDGRRKEPSRRDRSRPPYRCQSCGIEWKGEGKWTQAREHEELTSKLGDPHSIMRGDQPISWQ